MSKSDEQLIAEWNETPHRPAISCRACGADASAPSLMHVCECGESWNCDRSLAWLAPLIAAYKRARRRPLPLERHP